MTKTAIQKNQHPKGAKAAWKGEKPKGWKSHRAQSKSSAVGFQMVSVKMRPAEAEEFASRCKELGVSKNHALRVMAREVCGFIEVDKEALIELKDMSRQLRGIATNINQIAKAGNRTLDPDYRAFMEDRRELGPELIKIQKHLQRILDLGRRREDGLEKLKSAVNAS